MWARPSPGPRELSYPGGLGHGCISGDQPVLICPGLKGVLGHGTLNPQQTRVPFRVNIEFIIQTKTFQSEMGGGY